MTPFETQNSIEGSQTGRVSSCFFICTFIYFFIPFSYIFSVSHHNKVLFCVFSIQKDPVTLFLKQQYIYIYSKSNTTFIYKRKTKSKKEKNKKATSERDGK